MAIALTACGERVEVGPAQVGKIMTKDGYREGVIPTSKFRLDPCVAYCDKLVLLDVSDKSIRENMTVFMPQDKLNLELGVQVTLTLADRPIEKIFNSIPHSKQVISQTESGTEYHDRISVIGWERIYQTYAQQIVLTEVRQYISKYSIAEIASSLEKVNADLRVILQKHIQERTPFGVRYVGVTDIKYPKIITEAQENAAQRREQIQQEEAQLEISRVKLQRELEEAQLQRKIEIEKAETEAHAQRIQREVVDNNVLELRRLENQRLWIQKWNGQVPQYMIGEGEGTGLMLQLPQQKK
jgi:SPFH domain / Band 7 family